MGIAFFIDHGHLKLSATPSKVDDPVTNRGPTLGSRRHVDSLHLVVAMPTQNPRRPMLPKAYGRMPDCDLSIGAVAEGVAKVDTGSARELNLILRTTTRIADFKPEVGERS
jgi:hypothetical protein